MSISFPGHINVKNADQAIVETLKHIIENGEKVSGGKSLSMGSEKLFHELLNFAVVVNNPLDRLPWNLARRINLPAAVARFVWMMAGSDRLADIAFYEPKVRFFSDDGISIPGSNYGQRILQPHPGLDQLEAVIKRLRDDEHTRRAAISIYRAEDAVRDSKDIPCAFGIFYHIRKNVLHATTLMRSNNAFVLLPYNIFEFSLLAEVVAQELSVKLGTLSHIAISMHIYENDLEKSKKVISAFGKNTKSVPIPEIIKAPAPLQQIRDLIILEAELRHASASLSGENIEEWISKGQEKLNSYWQQLFFLLLIHIAQKNKEALALDSLKSVIDEPWISYLPQEIFEVEVEQARKMSELVDPYQARIIPFHSTATHRSLREHIRHWEETTGKTVPWKQFYNLEEHFGKKLAASGGTQVITNDEFMEAIKDLKL